MARSLGVVLLEDEPFFRHLLAAGLAMSPGVGTVVECTSAADLGHAFVTGRADVAVIDLVMEASGSARGRASGLGAALALREVAPQCGIVILTNHEDLSLPDTLRRHFGMGWAYLLKRRTDDLETLLRAITEVASGGVVVDPTLTDPRDIAGFADLSAHQAKVLSLVCSGLSNRGIAQELGVTVRSVEHAFAGACEALGIDTRDDLTNARVEATLAFARARARSES